jgi:hypothetical protein
MKNIFDLLHVGCRIPEDDCNLCIKSLKLLGYDDYQSFLEDLDYETISAIMKPGHLKRLQAYLTRMRENAKFNVINTNLSDDLSSLLGEKSVYIPQYFDVVY